MIRNTSIFVATFVLGALISLVARAALHEPHTGDDVHPGGDAPLAPMVSNVLAPAASQGTATAADRKGDAREPSKGGDHSAHNAQPAPDSQTARAKDDGKPVNTICAICGMEVDPNLPTATYQGKTIGFGCRMCPPKFRKNPDKYGPYYIRNEVAP